jgi:hypothetical protein
VHVCHAAQLNTLFSESIKKLVQLWTKCVKKKGTTLENYINEVFYLYGNKMYSYIGDNY